MKKTIITLVSVLSLSVVSPALADAQNGGHSTGGHAASNRGVQGLFISSSNMVFQSDYDELLKQSNKIQKDNGGCDKFEKSEKRSCELKDN